MLHHGVNTAQASYIQRKSYEDKHEVGGVNISHP